MFRISEYINCIDATLVVLFLITPNAIFTLCSLHVEDSTGGHYKSVCFCQIVNHSICDLSFFHRTFFIFFQINPLGEAVVNLNLFPFWNQLGKDNRL